MLPPMLDADIVLIRHHLQKLLSSEQMEKSEASRKLLCYLVERMLRQEAPKESEIAIDVFERDASFNGAEDSLVRVAVRTLRRRLADYYSGPGRHDCLEFALPKGGYRLTFETREAAPVDRSTIHEEPAPAAQPPVPSEPEARPVTPRSRRTVSRWTLAAGLLLAISAALNLYLWPNAVTNRAAAAKTQVAESPLWAGIVDSKRPLMVVLGDLFMYTQFDPSTGRMQMVRDTAINSSEELREFLAKNPPIAQSRGQRYMSVIQKSTALGMASVLQLVSHPGRRVEVRIGEEVQKEDIHTYDIVYIGPLARLGPLEGHYQLHSRFRYTPDMLAIRDIVSGRDFLPEGAISEQHTEYAIVARFIGPDGNRIVLITPGSRNSGMLIAVRMLTSPDGLKQLQSKLDALPGATPESFEALLTVTSYGQTDLTADIVEVHELVDSHVRAADAGISAGSSGPMMNIHEHAPSSATPPTK